MNPRWVESENSGRIRKTKFRDPEDTLATWSGVGLQPSWVKARLKEGYTLEDLRVEPSEVEP